MKKVPVLYDENVLVGFDRSDDAGVYKISDDMALVQTLDFFTPIADDPFIFGQITAANSLSDVYAMGGVPLTAMNIVAFPLKKFSLDVLSTILNGGLDILNSAGVQLLGGHSIDDPELKYGMSITGRVHPDRIIRNHGLRAGDVIVLTKPLGTGILSTAVKADMVDDEDVDPFIKTMIALNKTAAEVMSGFDVHACTDVTGFGLAGHLKEMLGTDILEIFIHSNLIPVLPGAEKSADMGLLPGGLFRNRDYIGDLCSIGKGVSRFSSDIIFDPQTSGGLLISLPEIEADDLINDLIKAGVDTPVAIAEVRSADTRKISVT